MTITDYKLKDFLKQPQTTVDEYMGFLKYLDPIPTDREVFHLKLKHVEFIKQNLYGDISELVARVQKINNAEVMDMHILQFFGLYNSIKDQIEKITRAEKNSLSEGGDPRFEAVGGGEIMAKYGIYNTILPLSEQFGWTIGQIENMPYSEVFSILRYNKDRTKVQSMMNQIKI